MAGPSHLRLVDSSPAEPVAGPRSLAEVFRQYSPYVAAIGIRLLGRVEEVEDLVQDVFVSAHRGLAGLREPGALKGWLATVTVRLAQRRLRSRRLRTLLRLTPAYDYQQLANRAMTGDERTLLGELYGLLDELPVAERVAWSLRHLEGEQLERVSELTGASLATVKRRIAAASAKLKERADG